jgi:hypothetical protein
VNSNTLKHNEYSLKAAFGAVSWLAQCIRRMNNPLDFSERSGLPAFEYGWKAFNSMYGTFSVDGERNKIKQCTQTHLPEKDKFVNENELLIRGVCMSIMSPSFKFYSSPRSSHRTITKVKNLARQLDDLLNKSKPQQVVETLSMIMYELRNARVHGDPFIAGSTMITAIGKADGSGNVIGGSTSMPSHFRSIAPAIFELDVVILSDMFSVDQQILRSLINVLETQLMEEISNTVKKEWKK